MSSSKNLIDPMDDPGLAAVLARGYAQAVSTRNDWVSLWQECYEFTLPENARFTGVMATPRRARENLYDGTASDAVDYLAASLLGNLTPPWVNWFGLSPGADVPDDMRADVSHILSKSMTTIQDQIDRSNLYTELHQCFLDLVVGGTACLQIIPEPLGAAVRFRASAIPLSEIVVADNAVYRPRVITAQELVELSGGGPNEQLKNPDDSIDIVEFSILHQGRYVQGVMIDGSSDLPRLVRAVMTDHSPYIVFRWQKTAGAAFGQSPVMKALPDIKTANTVVELILKNASIAVTGLWQAEDDGVMNLANITLTPGAIIPKAVGSAGLKPLEMPARFDVSQLVLDDLRARIRHALLADRFAQIETRRMTATEVIERADDSALILGAVYGRLQSELLTPLLTRLYDLYRAAGDIADLPLDGRTVQLLHRSPLARAQAMRGVQTILTLVDAAASLGANATATLNAPAIVRDIAETLGVPDHFIMPNPINALSIQSLTENIGE